MNGGELGESLSILSLTFLVYYMIVLTQLHCVILGFLPNEEPEVYKQVQEQWFLSWDSSTLRR